MPVAHYDASIAYDQKVKRGVPGQVARVYHPLTDLPIDDLLDLDGNPIAALVSNSQGFVEPFEIVDGPGHVKMSVGSLRYYIVDLNLVGASAESAILAAAAAERAANLVEAPADEVVKLLIEGDTLSQGAGDARWVTQVGADIKTADLIEQPNTLTKAALNAVTAKVLNERLPVVTVGATGEHATLNDVWTAYTNGRVHVDLLPGRHLASAIPNRDGFSHVIIEGHGRDVCRVDVAGPLISSVINMDAWEFRRFHLNNTKPTNTDHGIHSVYPRRWNVHGMHITGFGGDSVWYQGGINSWVTGNTFFARDSSNTNGRSAIHTTAQTADPNTAATTIQTAGNYVQGGKEYGFLFENTTIGSSTMGDVAEYCSVGFRFDRSSMSVISPYTEANTVGIQQHDCSPVFVGPMRDNPVITWSGVGFFDRRGVHIADRYIDPGKGIIYGGPTGNRDFSTAPSVRWDSANPNGRLSAPVGSLALNTSGTVGETLYIKESGTGNVGWVGVGVATSTTGRLEHAGNAINTSGKQAGRMVYNTSTQCTVVATGPNPTDVWVDTNGATVHTPIIPA